MQIVETSKGTVTIRPPTVETLKDLRRLLPYGICQFSSPTETSARFGIVMQCGDDEVWCIKQQPQECPRNVAEKMWQVQHWMTVHALALYIRNGFGGIYLPGPYLRERENEQWECGVAHFVFPSTTGRETLELPFERAFDRQFGHGATTMFKEYALLFMQVFRESKIPVPGYFGMDVRPRRHLQNLAMNFGLVGSTVLCLRANLRTDDVAWDILAANGVREVMHIPAVPMAIQPSELSVTKGESDAE